MRYTRVPMSTLLFERGEDGVVILTINRPEAHNALDLDTMSQFASAVARLSESMTLRAIIVTGAGDKAFCSGGDLTDFNRRRSKADGERMISLMGDALLTLERLPVPIIAAINGYAVGGGAELALACDVRIADEKTQFGMVHIRRGLIPGWGGGQRLLRLVGYGRAMEILLSGQILKPAELMSLGLVNQIVPAGTALDVALDLAKHIAHTDADAARAVKTLLQAGARQPYDAALQTERSLFPALWVGDTHVHSLDQFVRKQEQPRKRKPS